MSQTSADPTVATTTAPPSYRSLLRQPDVRAVVLSGAMARLPLQMFPFAVLLLIVRTTGSFAAAGGVAAAAAVGLACANPLHGRLLDRYGHATPLRVAAVANAAAFLALLACAVVDLGVLALGACAVAVTLTLPPVTVAQRALWPTLLPDPGRRRLALSLDAQLLDASMVAGPLLVSALAWLAGPTAAVAACGLAIQGGVWWFSSLPSCRAQHGNAAARRDFLGPLRSADLRALLAVAALAGGLLGAVRVGLVAFAGERGVADSAGLALAAFGLGSVLAGLLFGLRVRGAASGGRLAVLLGCYSAGTVLLVAAPSVPWLVVLCLLGGTAMGPVMVTLFELVGARAPSDCLAESYAWMVTATFLGAAVTNAVTGSVAAAVDARTALSVATGCGLLGVLVAALATRHPCPDTERGAS